MFSILKKIGERNCEILPLWLSFNVDYKLRCLFLLLPRCMVYFFSLDTKSRLRGRGIVVTCFKQVKSSSGTFFKKNWQVWVIFASAFCNFCNNLLLSLTIEIYKPTHKDYKKILWHILEIWYKKSSKRLFLKQNESTIFDSLLLHVLFTLLHCWKYLKKNMLLLFCVVWLVLWD